MERGLFSLMNCRTAALLKIDLVFDSVCIWPRIHSKRSDTFYTADGTLLVVMGSAGAEIHDRSARRLVRQIRHLGPVVGNGTAPRWPIRCLDQQQWYMAYILRLSELAEHSNVK